MHNSAYALMDDALNYWQKPAAHVLDIGSFNVNGTFRPLVEQRGWQYTGLDLVPGDNVDVVAVAPYCYPFPGSTFDIVMCGNMMHCVERLWDWIIEPVRILKPGGMLAIVTVHTWPAGNHYPVDCWRIQPGGMKVLFDWTDCLCQYNIRIANSTDLLALAYKQVWDERRVSA